MPPQQNIDSHLVNPAEKKKISDESENECRGDRERVNRIRSHQQLPSSSDHQQRPSDALPSPASPPPSGSRKSSPAEPLGTLSASLPPKPSPQPSTAEVVLDAHSHTESTKLEPKAEPVSVPNPSAAGKEKRPKAKERKRTKRQSSPTAAAQSAVTDKRRRSASNAPPPPSAHSRVYAFAHPPPPSPPFQHRPSHGPFPYHPHYAYYPHPPPSAAHSLPPPPGKMNNPAAYANGTPASPYPQQQPPTNPHGHGHAPSPFHHTPSPVPHSHHPLAQPGHPHNGAVVPPYGYYPVQYPQHYNPYGYPAPGPPPYGVGVPPGPQPPNPPSSAGAASASSPGYASPVQPSPIATEFKVDGKDSASSKRKRKGKDGKGKSKDGETVPGSDADELDMNKKRTKTQRACDSCRSRKIRCDVLSSDGDKTVCQHCKQYGFECTFFLPITETRFKKKRLEEEAAAAAAAAATAEKKGEQKPEIVNDQEITRRIDATLPAKAYHSFDQRYNHTWEVSKTGDGFIHVRDRSSTHSPRSPSPSAGAFPSSTLPLDRTLVEKLINSYFTHIAPLVPVLTQSEFLALSDPQPPPILLYSVCLVAAAQRDVPENVFESLRTAVNELIKSEDVLCTASVVNVQSLLVLGVCADCHSRFVPSALSSLWIRLGTAIRMAQDLGLHRAEAVKQNIEMRRRVWGACVISDRWTSLMYGHPYMIDVEDCDSRLPSSEQPEDSYIAELMRLSLILGRVQKTIYGPLGLNLATDEKLHSLLQEMKEWHRRLPDNLRFRGPETSRPAGLLYLLYASVTMIFWRVFMRISYSCPAHLTFALTIDQWTELVQMSGEAIEWLDRQENEGLYDVWMVVSYAATSCALVQYHTWARRRDEKAQTTLRKLRDCVRRWEGTLPTDCMSSRKKTAEIITLLYETTLGPPSTESKPSLNPTMGVVARSQEDARRLVYRADPSRPGGGVFIATNRGVKEDFRDLAPGTVVVEGDENDEVQEGEGKRGRKKRGEGEESENTSSPPNPTNSNSNLNPKVQMRGGSTGLDVLSAASASASAMLPSSAIPSSNSNSHSHSSLSSLLGPGAPSPSAMMIDVMPSPARPQAQTHQQRSHSTQPQPHHHQSQNQTQGQYQSFGNGNGNGNLNPGMGSSSSNGSGSGSSFGGDETVRVMNVLEADVPPNVVEQMQVADTGLLEGLPGQMFDWAQWDVFFQRFSTDPNALAAFQMMPTPQQQQQAQQQNGPMAGEFMS